MTGERTVDSAEWMNEPKVARFFFADIPRQFKFKCMRNHSLMPHPKIHHNRQTSTFKNKRNFPTWYLNIDGWKSTHVYKCNADQEHSSGSFYFPHLGGLLQGWGVTLFRVIRELMLIGKMKWNSSRGGVWISDEKSDSLPRIGSFELFVQFFYVMT